jgi:branched-subunit amino acid aminotransferase/4-amino-4-deoxychorismate lyase
VSSAFDHGRGVFETVLVADGRPIRLPVHLERMRASLRALFDAEVPATVPAAAAAAARGVELGRMRIDVSPAPGGDLEQRIAVTAIDPETFFPDRAHGADLQTVRPPAWPGAHKLADRDWLESVEAELGETMPLIVDGDEVLEAGRANVFAVREGGLVTPPLDGRILAGTARAATLALAAELVVATVEEPLRTADLHAAEEIFLTSSVRGIRPARSLDGAPLGAASELVPRLSAALRARWLAQS